jgi:monoamine oxidase
VLEARDRLGGRVFHGRLDAIGETVELGGTWFSRELHPPLAEEIERYGLAVAPAVAHEVLRWHTGGELRHGLPVSRSGGGDLERLAVEINLAAREVAEGAPGALERHDIPVTEWLDVHAPQQATRDFLTSWVVMLNGVAPDAVSMTSMLDAHPVHGSLWVHERAISERLADGTSALVDAVAADVQGTIELERPVTEIRQDAGGVTVVTADGAELAAATCVLAVPAAVTASIAFDPPLDDHRVRALDQGIVSRCVKLWAVADGIPPLALATGWGDVPLNWISCERELKGGASLVVGFGLEGSVDAGDPAAVETALRAYFPEARVHASGGHDWNADPWSRGAWTVRPPGMHVRGDIEAIARPHGRVVIASADIAEEFAGWIAGALESGRAAASEVAERLTVG